MGDFSLEFADCVLVSGCLLGRFFGVLVLSVVWCFPVASHAVSRSGLSLGGGLGLGASPAGILGCSVCRSGKTLARGFDSRPCGILSGMFLEVPVELAVFILTNKIMIIRRKM